ncbi:MAG TPA: type II toxin-antitoxin system VapC family toxin [Terriglobia bacterium]|nr:type II toxin-antitoxin system VapC family toxin [Terriglobia bacterium]
MLNLDTHIVIWMAAGELRAEEHSRIAKEQLAISDIVLWELAMLVRSGRVEMDLEGREFRHFMQGLTLVPISLQIARVSAHLDFHSDPVDHIIAATSIVERIPLLTRDRKILKSRMVPFALQPGD